MKSTSSSKSPSSSKTQPAIGPRPVPGPFGGWAEIEKTITPLAPAQRYPPLVDLFQQGEPASAVYWIARGVVKLSRWEPQGQEGIVGVRAAGYPLGAAAVILQAPYPVTAVTLTTCHIHRLPADPFRQLINVDPSLAAYLLQIYSREIYDASAQMSERGCLFARQRLGQLFWQLLTATRDTPTPPKGLRLEVPLKRWEMAQLIGVTPEHLSRVLKEMEQEGLLRRAQGWIVIVDPTKLWHHEEE